MLKGFCYNKTKISRLYPHGVLSASIKTYILKQILILIADAKFSTKILGQGQFVKTKRGNAQLVDFKGFGYNKTKISRLDPHRVFWICTKGRKNKCTARATTEGLNIISTGDHNHDPPFEIQDPLD